MKHISTLLIIAALAYSPVALATHITGGEISYDYLGSDQYNIRVKVYRDCGPNNVNGTPFDEPLSVGIFYSDGTLYITQTISLTSATITVLPFGVDNPCLVVPADVCIEEAVYQTEVWLPAAPGGYDLIYQRCCRSPIIINLDIPQDQGMTCSTHVPGIDEIGGYNSSATFTNLPPALMCTNETFSMDHSASDADGDTILYYLCQPFLGADPITPMPASPLPPPYTEVQWAPTYSATYPIASAPAFTINPTTGYFSGQPTAPGSYVFAICADEIRNGVVINSIRRDYMIQVVMCGQTIAAAIAPQSDPCQGNTISFQSNSSGGTEFFWDFGVGDTDADTSNVQNPEYTFDEYGSYTVTLIAQPGAVCGDTATTIVQINPEDPLLMSYIFSSPPPCDTSRVFNFQFNGENADVITWYFGDGTIADGEEIEHQYETNGEYYVQLTIYNTLCETTQSIDTLVSTDESILDLALLMPNVITPNGDNKNGELRPFSPLEDVLLPADETLHDYFDLFEMKVYSRWGNLVYDSSGTARGWDGKVNGDNAKGDVYYYIIHYSMLCDERTFDVDGHVTVLDE